jgi:hypothetical protein
MAKLPSDVDLGGLPSASSGRPIANYDTTGYDRGAAAIGAGVADLGKGVSSAAKDISATVNEQNKKIYDLQEAQSTADATSKVISLNAARDDDTDEKSLATYPQQHQQIIEDAAQGITDPQRRELWLLKNKSSVATQQVQTDDRIFEVQKSKAFARAGDQLFDLSRKGMNAKTDGERAAIIETGNNLISKLEEAQYITPDEAAKRRRAFANDYSVTTFDALPAAQRLEALAPVKVDEQARTAYKFFIGQGYSPAAAAGIAGNLVHESGMNPNSVNPGDGRDGSDSIGVAQWNSDRAARLKQFAKSIGTSPNDFTTQLKFVDYELKTTEGAAFKGLQSAATPKDAAAAFLQFERPAGYGAGPQSAAGWANRARQSEAIYADASGSKLPEAKGAALLKFMSPDQQAAAADKAAKDFYAGTLDEQRAAKLQQQQVKDTSDKTEMDILKDLYSDNPKNSVQSILSNPNLTREASERLLTKAQHALGGDKSDKTYGKGFYDAYQMVHAPDGTPGKITDPAELYKRVGQNGDLTVQGVDKLITEIQSRKTPEGGADAEIQKQFFSAVKGKISGKNSLLGIPDPKGEELFLKFMPYAYQAIADGKKEGKSIAQLLTPGSPDYIGKILDNPGNGFVRPTSEMYSDMISDAPPSPPPPSNGFDAAKVKSLDELMSAYSSGKVKRDVAQTIAIERGWATPAAKPASLVPVSQ